MVLLVSASEDSDAVGGGWTGTVTHQVEPSASQTALDPGKGNASSLGKTKWQRICSYTKAFESLRDSLAVMIIQGLSQLFLV